MHCPIESPPSPLPCPTYYRLPNGTNTEKLTSGDCKYADDPVNAPQHVYRCFLSEGGCEDGDDMAVDCGMISIIIG